MLLEPRQLTAERAPHTEDREVSTRNVRDGVHVTLIGWGGSTAACLDAADALEREAFEATVVALEHIGPLGAAAIGPRSDRRASRHRAQP